MPQLLAAAWLLRALGERCTLLFAGRLALAQGLRFLGPTGAPTNLPMFQTPGLQVRQNRLAVSMHEEIGRSIRAL